MNEHEHKIRVEHDGYEGIARAKRLGTGALKWEISIYTASGRELAYWEGPEIVGDGAVIPAIDDIEKAQHEINQAINQYLWDPMSQA